MFHKCLSPLGGINFGYPTVLIGQPKLNQALAHLLSNSTERPMIFMLPNLIVNSQPVFDSIVCLLRNTFLTGRLVLHSLFFTASHQLLLLKSPLPGSSFSLQPSNGNLPLSSMLRPLFYYTQSPRWSHPFLIFTNHWCFDTHTSPLQAGSLPVTDLYIEAPIWHLYLEVLIKNYILTCPKLSF